MSAYDVDLPELDAALTAMESYSSQLAALASDVEREVESLHASWAGQARDAHAASHARWRDECAAMRAALADLRGVGAAAHANYRSAVDANVAMWEQVR